MPDSHGIPYKLLTILQEIAPDGDAQQECTEYYHNLQKVWAGREDVVAANLAGAIVDGYRYGNWPWVVSKLNN